VLIIAYKEFETISAVLANRVCFDLFFGNLQRCNRVSPESKPGSSQRSDDANLEHPLGMQLGRLIPSRLTNKSERQSTNDDTGDGANVHKRARPSPDQPDCQARARIKKQASGRRSTRQILRLEMFSSH
jgi:hypothetical protein